MTAQSVSNRHALAHTISTAQTPRASVSVVMPAYNVEAYVQAAVQSVLAQTSPVHELIVIDDGSNDGTAALLQQYTGIVGFRYVRQENSGLGASRNRGAALATGDYIYFFDSDDLLDCSFVDVIQRQIDACAHRPEVLFFSGEAFFDAGFSAPIEHDYRRAIEASGISGTQALLRLCRDGLLMASACLYVTRAEFWRTAGLRFSHMLHEDENVVVPLFTQASSVVVTRQVLFYRRLRRGSITTIEMTQAHLAGRESNLRCAVRQIHSVPATNFYARKLLRRRCEVFAKMYLRLAQDLDVRPRIFLLIRALIASRGDSLYRKLKKHLRRRLAERLQALRGK